jgi:hypothetical protein
MSTYYHGTIKSRLESIAKHGLLPREVLESMGIQIVWPSWTKEQVVYLTTSEEARTWCNSAVSILDGTDWRYEGDRDSLYAVLAIEIENDDILVKDRNDVYYAWEHPGPIPPEKIKVKHKDTLIPIQDFVCCLN